MKDLGITKGKFKASRQSGKPGHCNLAQVFETETGKSVCYFNATKDSSEATNNAIMVTLAFKVANETGLNARRLLRQRDELLEIMKGLVSDVDGLLQEEDIEWHQAGYLETARELIQSIEKE